MKAMAAGNLLSPMPACKLSRFYTDSTQASNKPMAIPAPQAAPALLHQKVRYRCNRSQAPYKIRRAAHSGKDCLPSWPMIYAENIFPFLQMHLMDSSTRYDQELSLRSRGHRDSGNRLLVIGVP